MSTMTFLRGQLDARISGLSGLRCRGVGCSGCCSGPIPVTPAELVDLLPRVTRTQRNLARLVAGTETQYRCPLLGPDQACTVYDVRPLLCRGYTSTADPIGCDPSSRLHPRPHPTARAALDDALRAVGADRARPHFLADAVAEIRDETLG